jgi:hypothetical protein
MSREERVLITITRTQALRLRHLLVGVVEGWNLGDLMIQTISTLHPADPVALTPEDKEQMRQDRELISNVLDQLALKVLQ